jgi:L-cysteine S-thiosulfotransferase
MKMKSHIAIAVLAGLNLIGGASAQQPAKADPAMVAKVIAETFKSTSDEWKARIVPDETQKVCSQYRNDPPKELSDKLLEREKASVVYPADGKVLGDWKNGEKLAQRGTGGQFSDTADTAKGGNCYACHQMALKELSFGTLGPSLLEYGKARKFDPQEAKSAYGKIYDAQSVQPCSNMPRFGHNKFLTEQEIKDLTAYLFDPASPVNN